MTEVVRLNPHFYTMELKAVETQWTDERIIDLIRKLRNDLIKDFLDERHLKEYVDQQFRVRDLSPVKVEFIKKDLKELMISPVNLNHYSPLINQIRLTDSAALTESNEPLFFKEIEGILKRYLYQ
jgi:hypothetical protein